MTESLTLLSCTTYSAIEGIPAPLKGKNSLHAGVPQPHVHRGASGRAAAEKRRILQLNRVTELSGSTKAHHVADGFRFMAKGNFGERLKRERELREVSQNELTTATRISPRYLAALENEQWDRLPGGIFNRGFVRSIAKYLGLDEENLLAEYDEAHGESSLPVPQPYENKIPRPPLWIPIAFVLGALAILSALVAGGIYSWRYFAARRAAKRAASQSTVNPAPASADNTLAPDSAADSQAGVLLDLAVSTSAATHVRIVGDGKLLIDKALPVGETRHFSASRQFEVTAADSSAVLLELNGKAMPPIAAPGASGTITLSQKDLRQASSGSAQP